MRATRVVLDGIVFSLQRHGGISTYFRELASRVLASQEDAALWVYDDRAPAGLSVSRRAARLLERFRDPAGVPKGAILHTSYYRTSRDARANVVTVYDFVYERFADPLRRFVHSRQKAEAIRRADAIICISDATRRDLLEFHPRTPESKIHVIPLAAGGEFFPIGGGHRAPGEEYALFVGSRTKYKRFGSAVRAVAPLPGLRLVCVGGGDFTASERAALERAIPGRFAHAGYVDGPRLNELYNGATALLYTSAYEGFGIPILEAMAAGCPVVTTRAGSMAEVAGDAAILVDRPDADAITPALETLRRREDRAALVERGRRRAAMFSWDATAAKTLAVYASLRD